MWQLVFGFVLTVLIGSYITFKYQKRNIEYQSFLARERKRIDKINDIKKYINKLIIHRVVASRRILDCYQGIDKEAYLKDVRDEYILAKDKWNYGINSIFLELGNLGSERIYHFNAFYIERVIHKAFVECHHLIVDIKIKKNISKYYEAISILDSIYNMQSEITRRLTREVNLIQSNIKYGDTDPLSIENLDKASLLNLLFALFYKNPNLLRVPRS